MKIFWNALGVLVALPIIILFLPLILVYFLIEVLLFIGDRVVMPIYYFARYGDRLRAEVYDQQRLDEEGITDAVRDYYRRQQNQARSTGVKKSERAAEDR